MGKMQRTKGKAGENELLKLLNEHLGTNLSRNLQQTQSGGEDCTQLPYVAVEIKRHAKPAINAWWKQTVDQANASGKVPVLAYRLDRQQWVFVVPLYVLSPDFERLDRHCWHNIQYAASLTLDGFCAVIREYWAEQDARGVAAA